jgi:CRISPR-associated protein (Cas_Cas02710)
VTTGPGAGRRRPFATIGATYRGSVIYLQSALVALILAPVVPDMLIDLTGVHGRPTAAVRLAGVLLVVIICGLVFTIRSRQYRRTLHRASLAFSNVEPRDTLILVLSPGSASRYEHRDFRVGRLPSVAEILVEKIGPRSVVLLRSPEVDDIDWRTSRDALLAEDRHVTVIAVSNCERPEQFLDEIKNGLPADPSDSWNPSSAAVDVTAGTKLMSIAMLRLAADLNAVCVYVTSTRDGSGIKPGSQVPYQFEPRSLVGVTQ